MINKIKKAEIICVTKRLFNYLKKTPSYFIMFIPVSHYARSVIPIEGEIGFDGLRRVVVNTKLLRKLKSKK